MKDINSDFKSNANGSINNPESGVENVFAQTIKSDLEMSALFNKNLEKFQIKNDLEEGKEHPDTPSKFST